MCRTIFVPIAVLLLALPAFTNQARILPYRPAPSEWPEVCKGRTYCDYKPSYYPKETFEALLSFKLPAYNASSDLETRDGDVACSLNRSRFPRKIYLIKDSNDTIRFVLQTEKFGILLVVEECRGPRRVKKADYLNTHILKRRRVECVETKVRLSFPVLSLDGTTLDIAAPKGGIPISCSAKVMKN